MWTDLIALPLSVFFTCTPDEMLAFLKTFRRDPATGKLDESSLIPRVPPMDCKRRTAG
jgi:hypothetical protein